MNVTAENLTSLGIGLVEVVIFVGFLTGLWHLLNLMTRSFDDHEEIFVRGNWAYLVQRLGISVAQAVGMLSAIGVNSPNQWSDVGWLLIAGAWVSVLLLVVHPVVDRALQRVTVGSATTGLDSAHNHNLAVAIVKAAFYVAFGLVVNGSLTGSAPDRVTAVVATLVFTLLGGAVLVACYVLHDLVSPYAMRHGVAEGRLTSSLEAAGVLVALGLIMRNAIAGDFVGWVPALVGFANTALAGLIVLYLSRWLIDKLILTHATIKQVHESHQVTAAALLAALLPVVALPVTAVVGSLLA